MPIPGVENQPAEGVAVDGGWVLFGRVVGVDGSGLGGLLVASHVVGGGHVLLVDELVPGGPADGGARTIVHVQVERVLAVAESLRLALFKIPITLMSGIND